MNELQKIIGAETAASGPISCARFMELALYHETLGYYEKRSDQVGTAGDFITSVSVGDLFGRLLAARFERWLEELAAVDNRDLFLVEAGAHTGQLMHDVLTGLVAAAPRLCDRLRCIIIEPSEQRAAWQREVLSGFAGKVEWCANWQEFCRKYGPVDGVIYSNELLDAFPVHRFLWDADAKRWFELGVTGEADLLIWTRMNVPADPGVDPELCGHLPNGFIFETSPSAIEWWTHAANCLRSGKLLAIDYGVRLEELLNPVRSNGTLRAYRDHLHAENPLANPGEQDITTTVNWTAFREVGEQAGLTTEDLVNQSTFLTRTLEQAIGNRPADWQLSPKQIRQFQMLTHPEHLGQKFQAFVQGKESAYKA